MQLLGWQNSDLWCEITGLKGTSPDNCESKTATFTHNPLTHSGTGSNSATLSFQPKDRNVSFTISGISLKGGAPKNKYAEKVTVTWSDGTNVHTYGVFSGINVSLVNVIISGIVQSVTD